MEFENGDIVAISYTNRLDYGIVLEESDVSLQFYSLYSYSSMASDSNLPNGNYSPIAYRLKNNLKFKKTWVNLNSSNRRNGIRALKITKELLPAGQRVVYDELIKLL